MYNSSRSKFKIVENSLKQFLPFFFISIRKKDFFGNRDFSCFILNLLNLILYQTSPKLFLSWTTN